jgi:hypothetical protein
MDFQSLNLNLKQMEKRKGILFESQAIGPKVAMWPMPAMGSQPGQHGSLSPRAIGQAHRAWRRARIALTLVRQRHAERTVWHGCRQVRAAQLRSTCSP